MAQAKPQFTRRIEEKSEFDQKVLQISRVSRTVAGGRRMRFRALIIMGDKNGRVGLGIGKGNDVATAVQKATHQGKKNMIKVPITEIGSIPHEITSTYGSARIILKPAPEGTSIIAGNVVRTIAELAGIRNLVSKIIGSSNKINNSYATLHALEGLRVRPVKVKTVKKEEE